MSFGRKYDSKVEINQNPSSWEYSPDFRKIKDRSSNATIMPEHVDKRPENPTPDAGMYEPHKPFGEINQSIDFGSKYEFKPDQNPPPGFYNPNIDAVKPKVPNGNINPESWITKRVQLPTPGSGSYDPYQPFGDNLQNIDFGSKYEFKPDQNPPPGFYNPDQADSQTKPSSTSFFIREEVAIKVNKE